MPTELKTERIFRGEVIRASMLNNHAQNINFLKQRPINPPKQTDDAPPPKVQNEDPGDSVAPSDYLESSRSTSLIQVFDQNETNYAEIERIDTVTFKNDNGDTITLRFNNS